MAMMFAIMITFTGCLNFNKKVEVDQPKKENNAENNSAENTNNAEENKKYGRFTIQTYDENSNPTSAPVFLRGQKTGAIVRNALNEVDGNSSGDDGIYSYLYEPGEYRIDIGNVIVQENINLKAGEEKVIKVYLSSLELTTKRDEVIFKIKTTNDNLVDGQMVKAGKIWTKELPAGEYKIIKEMVDGEIVNDEYQFFTIKRGEKTKIEL